MAVQPETPLQTVKRLYGNKDKLVDQLAKTLADAEEDAGEFKERLLKSSNQKLLRLAEVGKRMSEKYGDKDKLVAFVAQAWGKTKDLDFVAKLSAYTPARLLDMAKAGPPAQRKKAS